MKQGAKLLFGALFFFLFGHWWGQHDTPLCRAEQIHLKPIPLHSAPGLPLYSDKFAR